MIGIGKLKRRTERLTDEEIRSEMERESWEWKKRETERVEKDIFFCFPDFTANVKTEMPNGFKFNNTNVSDLSLSLSSGSAQENREVRLCNTLSQYTSSLIFLLLLLLCFAKFNSSVA